MADAGDLYLLGDGTYADPSDCAKGDDGVLRHENGVAVALRDDGEPMTLAKVTEHNVQAAEAWPAPAEGPAVEERPEVVSAEPVKAPEPPKEEVKPPVVGNSLPHAAQLAADAEPKPAAPRDMKAD